MALLTEWRPMKFLWDDMSRFHRQFDRLFDRFGYESPSTPALAASYPAMNLWEDDDYLYVESELPGVKLEDLEIVVSRSNVMTIKGSRKAAEHKGIEWHRQERTFGNFERTITLPGEVDAGKVEARLEHGVLTIKMAKMEAAKARRIPVKAG